MSALPPNIPDLSLTKLELGEPRSIMIVLRSNFPYAEALAAGQAQELAMYLRGVRTSVPELDFSVSVWDPDAEEGEGQLVDFTTRAAPEPDPPAPVEANKRYTPPNGHGH